MFSNLTNYKQFNPSENPDAQEALSNAHAKDNITIRILRSGAVAIFDRGMNLRELLDELPTKDQLRGWSQKFAIELRLEHIKAESEYYGEPGDRELAADIKRNFNVPKQKKALAIEVEF